MLDAVGDEAFTATFMRTLAIAAETRHGTLRTRTSINANVCIDAL